MKLLHETPPNYEEICKVFPVRNIKTVVFTYGDTVYYPGKSRAIPDHLKVHENVHSKQQGDDPAGWWTKYLNDKVFRLSQEVEAYANQYRYFTSKNHNFKEHDAFMDKIASDLSGPMYGGLVTYEEAKELIFNKIVWQTKKK